MVWLAALLHFLFPAPAVMKLVRAAYGNARLTLGYLVDPATGAITPTTPEDRRAAAQRLHDCEMVLFLAIDDRARQIAGLPPRRETQAELRLSELGRRDVSVHSLIKRSRSILDRIRRFARLARRRALKLKRHAERKLAMANAATLTIFVMLLLAALNAPAGAPASSLPADPHAFADARIRAPP